MAEFQEVMRQWVRARKATKSSGEENNILSGYPLEAYDSRLIANIEENVMSWAAKHPEPKYPTWMEYLFTIYDTVWPQIATMEIPADIAEKLGLEPKEAT